MFIKSEIIEGIFIRECSNRFLCEVLINNTIEECYVPSSSRMENYLKLKNKKVLLTLNKNASRTKYSLLAVEYYNKYILLNLNKMNDILEHYLSNIRCDSKISYKHLKEKTINGYKADLIVTQGNKEENKTIIEAKGIIDIRNKIVFPKVHSDRAIEQLLKLKELLKEGQSVEYYLVALSPIVKAVTLNKQHKEYYDLIEDCINQGLKVQGLSVNLNKDYTLSFGRLKICY